MGNAAYREELHTAVTYGNYGEVRRLIDLGASLKDIASWDEYGRTPLGAAASLGNIEITQLLLSLGAEVSESDYEGYTAIDYAVWGRHYDILFALIEYGDFAARIRNGAEALYASIEHGNLELVVRLLDAGVDIDSLDEDGRTPLIAAADWRHSVVDRSQEKREIVRLLLERGADINRRVLEGNGKGVSAIFFAARKGDSKLVHLLRSKGAILTLHEAVMIGDRQAVESLLDQGEDPNRPGPFSDTPLYLAAQHGQTEIVYLLLSSGADALQQVFYTNNAQKSVIHDMPLMAAAEGGHTETVAALLKYDAGKQEDVSVLNAAAYEGYAEIVRLLLKQGWNINGTDEFGMTPLMTAAANDQAEMISLLLAGADRDAQNEHGFTALMCAAQHNGLRAAQALLQAGARTDLRSHCDLTAEDEARGHGHLELAALLQSAAKSTDA